MTDNPFDFLVPIVKKHCWTIVPIVLLALILLPFLLLHVTAQLVVHVVLVVVLGLRHRIADIKAARYGDKLRLRWAKFRAWLHARRQYIRAWCSERGWRWWVALPLMLALLPVFALLTVVRVAAEAGVDSLAKRVTWPLNDWAFSR